MIFNNYAALYNGMYDPYKDSPADAVAEFGVKTGLALTASFFAKYVPTGIPLEKLRYLNEYTILDPVTGNYIAYANWFENNGGSIKRATSSATIKELIWNSIKFAEEQLFKIPRTFSASSYVGMNTIKDFEFVYDVNSPTIQNQMKYLEAISEGKINKMTIGKQVKFSGGKLYSISETGEESVLLKNATAIPFEWGRNTPTKYISKFAKALFEQHGMSAPKDLDFIFTGGNNWLKGAKEKLGGFSTAAIENYVKLLDDPFGLLREVLDSSGHHLPRIDKLLTKGSAILDKVFMKDMFGVGGFNNMKNRSAMQLMKLHFNKIAPMAIMGIVAYKVVNAVLQDAFDTDLKGMGAQVYQDVSKGISAVSDYTGLTLLGKAQEELAPGSSKLSALAAIPISMAIMGGTLGAITNVAAKEAIGEVAQGPNWFRGLMTNLETTPGVIGEAAEKLSFSKLGRSGAYGAIGAIVGTALVAPFIPGALGDQYTLEERKDLYSGEEYVAHKRGRFWEFGCVKEDTPITTDKGIKPIVEVEEGDLVLTHEGEWKKVYACVRQSMDNKRLFKVKPYMSDEYIEITGNHEVPSWLNGVIKDRPVYDLIGSEAYIGFPIMRSARTTSHIETVNFGSIPMGYNLGKLIGLYLTNGHTVSVGSSPSHLEFSISKDNYFTRFDIIESMRYVFDKNPIYSYDSDNVNLIYFAADIAAWVSSIENNLFSETHIFNNCDNENFYIGILFGAIAYDKTVAYYKGSLDSCLFLRNISFNLGIVPELAKNSEDDSYMLVWRKSEFAKLNNLFSNINIEIKSCYYKDIAFIENDTFWMRIEYVEEVEKPEFVYDLAVEDHKTYTTTSFTIHNTSPFEGDQTLFYAPHWTVRAKTDAVRKGILPEEDYNSQLAYLIKRLVDPYYLEKATDKERPYTYWGASDMGLGIFETLATPIVHAFKPTIVAHREAVGKLHPSQLKRSDIYIPDEAKGNDRIKTRGYAREADDPSSTSALIGKLLADVEHVFGIQGYAVDNLKNLFTGGNSPFVPEAISESSGRMMSANRLFWQMGLGGGASSTEAYRRLNPQRPYETQYLMSPIRNTMPEWIGREDLKYGDAFSGMPYGDIRLPGRGYQALHPELQGLDPEDYPAIHRMNILADVAPMSPGFYEAKANVENQMAHGELSRDSEALYNRIMEQRKEIREGPKFDYGGNPIGDYWLSLKQLGRSLPTESLYPLSPVHKFSGPVDPVTDYKSFNVLDKQFKSWDNPITDYAKPTWNRAIDFFGYGDFTPMETKEHSQIESYFMGLQFAKNNILSDKATEAFKDGQYQLASFYRKGLRPTLHGMSPYEDAQDLDALMPDREKGYLEAFMNDPDKSRQASSLKITTPYMSQALKGQFLKEDLEERREYDKLQEIQVDAPAIRGVSLNEFTGSQIPGRNFVGYAPGVDLNALKVKTVNHLGQNIRDYSLWREDEISAQLLDKSMGGLSPYNVFDYANREHSAGIYNLQKKLYQLGNRDMQITAVPTGGSSSINFNIKRDNRQDLKDIMQQEGYISY